MAPHDHMVMALVDRRHLYRPPNMSVSGIVESCIAHCFSDGYVGHYVLITGYDAEQQVRRCAAASVRGGAVRVAAWCARRHERAACAV